MHPWVATAIAVDIVINALLVMWIIRRRRGVSGVLGVDFAAVRKFSDAAAPLVHEFMQSNYSGEPSTLPVVLAELLDRLEAESRSQGLKLDRGVLRSVMKQMVAREHLARSGELSSAIEKVA